MNSPNQSALTYRIGTHPTFLQRMLARVRTQSLADGKHPLAALTTRASDDPAIALLDAWAVVGDVLTFYQERIANEGYLRTATELFSAAELAHAIGYQLKPGVAASTSLAFTVEAVDTSGIVSLPLGIQVQSIPGQDQLPQPFETVERLKARPEWNRFESDRRPETITQGLQESTNHLKLAGSNTALEANDTLLIIDKYQDDQQQVQHRWYVVTIQAVEPNTAEKYTTVTFDKPLAESLHAVELQVFAFRQQAALFGHDAPAWKEMPDEVKREESGVKSGLYRLTNQTQWQAIDFQSPYLEFQALAAHRRGETDYLFAGTAGGGVFRSIDHGQTWTACNTSLSNLMINALFSFESMLYAGTTNGTVFRSLDNGQNWEQFSTGSVVERVIENGQVTEIRLVADGLPKMAIHAFTAQQENNQLTLYAGTDNGVYQSDDQGVSWQRTAKTPLSAVRALLVKGNELFAGTSQGLFKATLNQTLDWSDPLHEGAIYAFATDSHSIWAATDKGIYQSADNGETWTAMSPQVADTQRLYGLTFLNNTLFAAAPFAGSVANEWPAFEIEENEARLDLDAVHNKLLADSWIILRHDSRMMLYQIKQVSTIQGDDFTLRRKISRLQLTTGQGLRSFGGSNLRGTEVLLQSEPIALFSETRTRTTPVTGNRITLASRIPTLEAGRRLIISGKRLQQAPTTNNDTDEIVSEVAFVQGMEDKETYSTITLREALQNSYDPATVTIQANVVLATHGETVANEVLGSGDGTQANQRFRLKKPPLTYLPAPTESGVRSTLRVYVNDIEWQEAPSLNDLHERSQSYTVHHNSLGQPTIIFGDGQKGARLPTGIENVVATYRSGIGLEGEVDANTLVLLQTSPLGVLDVTNPLPASGAASPDWEPSLWGELDDTREKAPLSVLTMDRIVSLSDFENFTRTFAGIGKVQGKRLWTSQSYLVHLTIADSDGDAIPRDSALYGNLLKAINKRRNPLLQKMQIDSYDLLLFHIVATVFVDPRYKKEKVERDIKHALQETFSFAKRAFAQNVAASDMIAIMQSVAGVVAVDLDYLYLEHNPKQLNNLLCAEAARWEEENKEAKPAQLLLLKKDGITLTMKS